MRTSTCVYAVHSSTRVTQQTEQTGTSPLCGLNYFLAAGRGACSCFNGHGELLPSSPSPSPLLRKYSAAGRGACRQRSLLIWMLLLSCHGNGNLLYPLIPPRASNHRFVSITPMLMRGLLCEHRRRQDQMLLACNNNYASLSLQMTVTFLHPPTLFHTPYKYGSLLRPPWPQRRRRDAP